MIKDSQAADRAQLATKHDLTVLKHDLAVLKSELEAKIEIAKSDLIRCFADVMIAQGLAVVVATVTLIKLLPG